MGLFDDPHVYPSGETVKHTVKAIVAAVRGDEATAAEHMGDADASQRRAVERGTNRGTSG